MKRILLLLITSFFVLFVYAQTTSNNSMLNLDFEYLINNMPKGWTDFGNANYQISIDSVINQHGKNAAVIEFKDGTPGYKASSYTIPAIHQGNKIKLTGYIKTANVTDGYAGLWMRIDPNVSFDNMGNRGITGSNDWKKYEIELDLKPKDAEQIVIGGLLVGKGKMWIDNLEITIDGKPLNEVPLKKVPLKEIFKADADHEFDKGSGIPQILLNKKKITDLQQLGLIWGFLKYYHPTIAGGNYNWDYELFRILPKFTASKSNIERDNLLFNWIKQLGNLDPVNDTMNVKQDIKMKPDLDWISNLKSNALVKELIDVKNAKRAGKNYYVGLYPFIGNPEIKNEKPYEEMNYTDVGFRILSLYRYWNIIQYYYPDKNLLAEDWKNVLTEFIPKFIQANDELTYKLAVLELIGRVHDTHANIWSYEKVLNEYWGTNYAPLAIRFIGDKAIVTGFSNEELGQKTGLQLGDEISKINHKSVANIIKERLKYTPASNYPTQLRQIGISLLRTNDSILNIDIVRNNKPLNKVIQAYQSGKLNMYEMYNKKDSCFRLINSKIAYINNGTLKKKYIPQLWKEIQNTKGLIIDNRNYPSDFPIFELSSHLVSDSTSFVKFTKGSITRPGLFEFTGTLKIGKQNNDSYKGKVIILVNETSQSSSEYHALAYRASPNALVVGSTTAGADGDVSRFSLPGGINTMISGIGVYYPEGRETQRIGIVPDIIIIPTIESVKQKKDIVLEKAIELIENSK